MNTSFSAQRILLEGVDANAFAQAQFASDVDGLETGRWQFSSWLDPKGRVRAWFHLLRHDDLRLSMLLRGGEAAGIAAALARFVLRARVGVHAMAPAQIATGAALDLHRIEVDGDILHIGCGAHRMLIGPQQADTQWHAPQLRLGWPWLPATMLDDVLVSTLDFDRLGAIRVDKGCYPGQEIVARLHFRGGNKRHLRLVWLTPPCAPGSVLHLDGREVAQAVDAIVEGDTALALAILHDDLIEQIASGTVVLDEGVALRGSGKNTGVAI